ncbi:MAG: hypothetical protein A2527_12655 [Candidatus Lambdaproteobacteria bacterium RIFOXYD2_FULL_50_16]|uniref:YtkA-like domain-containing protein n=1 Tax=Candidatus Lambdaproteobacteria bacterium RIFOXYD2_FULL_50_16 TaxID=1817772 RepID=A0A1F6GA74_9PROT|nr:MAG: hypothetical protein A2527_12655 [Candidatus Lambdaproteobacteria bacterium RIFOXYD2_FULL_50_16]
MKKLILLFSLLFLTQPLWAADLAKLGPNKKTEFVSKHHLFIAQAPLVPVVVGEAEFEITLTDQAGQAFSGFTLEPASLEMPGMAMKALPVQVTPIAPNRFKVHLTTEMAGLWQVRLPLTAGGQKDWVLIKFVVQ